MVKCFWCGKECLGTCEQAIAELAVNTYFDHISKLQDLDTQIRERNKKDKEQRLTNE